VDQPAAAAAEPIDSSLETQRQQQPDVPVLAYASVLAAVVAMFALSPDRAWVLNYRLLLMGA
jgi:hypothetical protein